MSRIVVAVGGNALIRRGEEGSTAVQRWNLLGAARALADLEAAFPVAIDRSLSDQAPGGTP